MSCPMLLFITVYENSQKMSHLNFRVKISQVQKSLLLYQVSNATKSLCFVHLQLVSTSTVSENLRKRLIYHCKRSELRLDFEWTKNHEKG